jgi:hypothetical protein
LKSVEEEWSEEEEDEEAVTTTVAVGVKDCCWTCGCVERRVVNDKECGRKLKHGTMMSDPWPTHNSINHA